MKITRFEDLEIWKETRELCKIVYEITSTGPFSTDFKFRDQMRASSGSAMDNIAEGFERGGNKEFVQFLWVSKGSTGEVRSQSYRAYDVKHINEKMFNELLKRTDSICRKTFNLIQHLRDSDIKGIKYF
jgi:four helix bundle protein